ncbi:MAG: hypothetical protein IT330_18370 [Anaerolineae bacterium]|nr:hypothetical protein [Anaerolineae bacterium]
MARELKRMSFAEFVTNLDYIFDRIVREEKEVVVEKEDKIVILRPGRSTRRRRRGKASAADEAFRSAFGGWKGIVDVGTFKENVDSARGSGRPPVSL